MDWSSLKDEAARMLLEKDALHIYAALLIQAMAAKLSRRSLGDLFPWLAVFGLEMVNEIIDLARGQEPVLRPWQIVSGLHDIVNTMILPTVLLMLCRRDPTLFRWNGNGVTTVGDGQRDPRPGHESGRVGALIS